MKDALKKELKKRGTAEVSKDTVMQVTQAINESSTEATFLMFGELQKQKIMPIDKACAKCNHRYFKTIEQCQKQQKKDAMARGFNNVVCPEQFI